MLDGHYLKHMLFCTCRYHYLHVIFPSPHFLQVLRFYAYFQESVHEQRQEQYRIRRCIILYYLEDDTVQVNEPRVENAGIPQGQPSHTPC